MITKDLFVHNPNALNKLVEDATQAGLTVEHDSQRPGAYIIGGIQVWDTWLYTVNFGKVRKLIEERLSE